MPQPRVEIRYCRQCQWLLRAAWYSQELLTTFSEQLGEVALVPTTGGVFQVIVFRAPDDEQLVWDRKEMDGFPEIKLLKQRIRDVIAPDFSLGHADRNESTSREQQAEQFDP